MASAPSNGLSGDATPSPVETSEAKNASPPRVLIVDDEKLIADTVAHILNKSGFSATCVYNGDNAIEAVKEICPDIVLSDVRMPGRNGVETAILIQQQCPSTKIVLFSGQASTANLVEQARKQGHGFTLLPKPIHPRELAARLRAL